MTNQYEDKFTFSSLLRMCKASRSSINQRRKARAEEEQKVQEKKAEENCLKELMRQIVNKIGYVPGERGFKVFLWRDHQMNIGRKMISRLMKEMNLKANRPKPDAYKGQAKHDHPCTAPENLVEQNFKIAPRRIICTDITYIYFGVFRTQIYLCVFRDAYTREIIGWALKRLMTTALVKAAYDNMMKKHGKELKNPNVIIHSDQGSQYLSTTFKQILEEDEFLQSVSGRGNSQDNAPVESFFSRMKTVLIDLLVLCRTFEDAEEMIGGYINSYNNELYQYELAGLTPHEFYLYKTTGIYPCDNYFGKKVSNLRDLHSIIDRAIERAQELAKKHRDIYRERSRASQLLKKDPLQITIEDQKLLERMIKRYRKHCDKINDEIERLEMVLAEAKEAQEFLGSMSPEEREQYKTAKSWQSCEKLQYIYGMGGLF